MSKLAIKPSADQTTVFVNVYSIDLQSRKVVGDGQSSILSAWFRVEKHLFDHPVSRRKALHPILRFRELEDWWKKDTQALSSPNQIAMHPAYQHIIGLGPAAIPLILKSLKKESAYWYWALKAISHEDPVPPEHRGNIEKMRQAWLKWGKMYLENAEPTD